MNNNQERIAELEKELTVKKQELAELKRNSLNEQIEDYSLKGPNGSEVNISKLFGSRDELLVIHNMGKGGHNGVGDIHQTQAIGS